MAFEKSTEDSSNYHDLEQQSILTLLQNINQEDMKVAIAVKEALPQINLLVQKLLTCVQEGGRLFYIGAGTSGRLGILDASECPPTYGVSPDLVTAIIAGGDLAIRSSREKAEDNPTQAWLDLQQAGISKGDFVIGIAASGTTPYVIGAIQAANLNECFTGCITCNNHTPLAKLSQYPIEVITGPEFVTGSTRMKAGTAQKMILNMISTTLMIQLGHVKGNQMIDMQLTNEKLIERAVKMIVYQAGIDVQTAKNLLLKHGSVRKVLDNLF